MSQNSNYSTWDIRHKRESCQVKADKILMGENIDGWKKFLNIWTNKLLYRMGI